MTSSSPPPTDPPPSAAVNFVRDAAVALCNTGVPTSYVTSRVQAIAAIYHVNVTVFALPTGVLIRTADGSTDLATASGTVTGTNGFRLDQLADLTTLLDDARAHRCRPEEAIQRLEAIEAAPPRYGVPTVLLGHALFGLGFGLLLKPTLLALPLYAVMSAAVGGLGMLLGRRRDVSIVVFPVLAAFLVTAVMETLAPYLGETPSTALIPPLVSLLPAAAMTFALMDLSTGDAIAGSSRLAVALQRLLLMALGAYVASALIPSVAVQHQHGQLGAGPWIGVAVFCLGTVLTQSARTSMLPYLMVIAYVTFTAQTLADHVGGPILGGFAAGVASVVTTSALQGLPQAPPFYAGFAPVLWLVVPGAAGLQSALDLSREAAAAAQIGLTGMILVAIATGILVATVLLATLGNRPANSLD